MAETSGAEIISKGLGYLVAGGGLAALGAFVNGLLKGTQGQEKELREGMAEEIQTLRDELRTLRAELSDLRDEIGALHGRNSKLFADRETARYALQRLERKHGEPETVWPADGGTP